MTWLAWALLSRTLLFQAAPTDGTPFFWPLPHVSATQASQATFLRRAQETVVYVPGVGVGMHNGLERLSAGPIASVRTFVAAHGVALTLKHRAAKAAPSGIRFATEPHVGLCEGACASRVGTAVGPKSSVPLAAPVMPAAPQQVSAKERSGWPWLEKSKPSGAVATAPPLLSTTQVLGLAASCVAAALLLMLVRRRHAHGLPPGSAIRVLSVQSMGGKHRLALVETCGERLLLAITDTEVSVLTHVATSGSADALASSFTAEASEHKSAGATAPAAAKPYEVQDGGEDVAGLLRLRRSSPPSHLSVVQ